MDVRSDDIAALIRDCAARLIMPRFKMLQEGEISSKSGPSDLVTIADREMEAELERALNAAYPGSIVLGEESVSAGEKTLDALADPSNVVWVIDPVDGTWNFVHGKNEFAVMLACVIGGRTRHGWIYDVPADRMMYTEQGQGTWIDGQRQKVAPVKPWRQTIGFCGAHYFPPAQRPMIKTFAKQVKGLHLFGCAGHEYLNVASGLYDFALYNRGKPWDHLAGALAVQEAGGVVSRFDGNPYLPSDDRPALLCTSNDLLQEILQRELIGRLPEAI